MTRGSPIAAWVSLALAGLLACSSRRVAEDTAAGDTIETAACFDGCLEETFGGTKYLFSASPTYIEPSVGSQAVGEDQARLVDVWPCGACDASRCSESPTLISADVTAVDYYAELYGDPSQSDSGPVYTLGTNLRAGAPQFRLHFRELLPASTSTIAEGTKIRGQWRIRRGCHGPVAIAGVVTAGVTIENGHMLLAVLIFGVPRDVMDQPGFCGACVTVDGNLGTLDGKRSWRVATAARLPCSVHP